VCPFDNWRKKIRNTVGYKGRLEFDASMPDGAAYKTVDGRKGEALLGWKPPTSLEDGIRETVNWYLENCS